MLWLRPSSTPAVAYGGSFCWFRLTLCSLWLQTCQNARHLGRYGPEEHGFTGDDASRACRQAVVDMLLVCNDRCLLFGSADNCGFSAVAAQQQGRQHPCHDAEADTQTHQLLLDKTVDVPVMQVVLVSQVPQMQAVQETVVLPQFQLVENLAAFAEVSLSSWCRARSCSSSSWR